MRGVAWRGDRKAIVHMWAGSQWSLHTCCAVEKVGLRNFKFEIGDLRELPEIAILKFNSGGLHFWIQGKRASLGAFSVKVEPAPERSSLRGHFQKKIEAQEAEDRVGSPSGGQRRENAERNHHLGRRRRRP